MEEKQRTPFGLIQKEKSNPYEIYKGRNVRIHTGGHPIYGRVEEVKDGLVRLKPSMISEGEYNDDGQYLNYERIEYECPTIVNAGIIQGIQPLSEGYLEKLANSTNSIHFINPENEKKSQE